jgi:hypothetical protein
LSFNSTVGAGAPAAQTANLTLATGSLSFTAVTAVTSPVGGNWLRVSPGSGTASGAITPLSISVDPTGLNPGTYNGTVTVTANGATNSPLTMPVTYTVSTSGGGGGGSFTKVLPHFPFGNGFYSSLYFTNNNTAPVTFTVSFINTNGTALVVPALGGSTITVNLPARGTAILEAPNVGTVLNQGYVLMTPPAGVTGYGVFRQTLPGLPDQEAVVEFSNGTATISTLLFDETKYVNGVAVVNLGSFDTNISVIARDPQGITIGSGTVTLPARNKTQFALRDIPGLSQVVGKMGSVDFSVPTGSLATLGIRFNGPAFTSVPSADR